MKFDVSKLITLIGIGMAAVEKIKSAPGAEKEAAVIETIQEAVPAIEGAAGLDFVNDDALNALLKDYIAAKVALVNGIAHAKQLKPPTS